MLHWRKEVVAFHQDMLDRTTPSMRSRLDMSKLWQQAAERTEVDLAVEGDTLGSTLPSSCPLVIEDLINPGVDFLQAVENLRKQID